MGSKAIQDLYPEEYSRCFGCGRLNAEGHHLKSFREGDEIVARFTPAPYHIAVPGFVYGGLIASLIDCHAVGTAATAGRDPAAEPVERFVTASLKVDFLRPTPLGRELELRARVREDKGRKRVVEVRLYAQGLECARGEVVAVALPATMARQEPSAGAPL